MKKVWILVYVWRGLIQEPELFFNKNSADNRQDEILNSFNPAYDEIEVFKKYIF